MYNDGNGFPTRRSAVAIATRPPMTTAPRWRNTARRWAAAAWREPLSHFLAFGILIFIVAHALEARSQRYRIDVSPAQVTRIVNSYAQQYGAAPDPAQVRTMVDNYIREEIYLREGLALGLDQDDEIVRRRIAQKYDFLQQDVAVPRLPAKPNWQRGSATIAPISRCRRGAASNSYITPSTSAAMPRRGRWRKPPQRALPKASQRRPATIFRGPGSSST